MVARPASGVNGGSHRWASEVARGKGLTQTLVIAARSWDAAAAIDDEGAGPMAKGPGRLDEAMARMGNQRRSSPDAYASPEASCSCGPNDPPQSRSRRPGSMR